MLFLGEGIGRFLAEVEIDARLRCTTPGRAADGQVHRREPPGGGIGYWYRGPALDVSPLQGSGRWGWEPRAMP